MIDLYGSQITQILPDYFSQMAEVKSLSYAVSQAVKRLIKYCRNIGVYSQVEYLTEDMLDMLAVELDTQHYDNSLSLETKRKIIKNTLVWYMSAGTPSAVEELVETVFGEGKVTEWFEYADDPYYFKIQTNALMTQDIIYEFTRLLQKAKNARSHIRAIEVHRTIDLPYYSGECFFSEYRPAAIIPASTMYKTIDERMYQGMQGMKVMHPAAIMTAEDTDK